MTAWARLTWQAADPAALAADLEYRLGILAEGDGLRAGARVLRLGDTGLDLVPWRWEGPDDHPHIGGRLVFEPVEFSVGTDTIGIHPGDGEADVDRAEDAPDAPDARDARGGEDARGGDARAGDSSAPTPVMRLAGVGWATVELDGAEAELDPWLGPAVVRGDGTEPHLGARTRVRRSMGLPGRLLVLAEPVTEGRLAASLVRDGEGPCALYLEPSDGLEAWLAAAVLRGVSVSAIRPGPIGPSVIIAGVPSGPHLVIVAGPDVASARAPGGTIAP